MNLVQESLRFAAIVAVALPFAANADDGPVSQRPLSDFLTAQGSTDPGIFFPPVPDYVGWSDNPFTTFCLVDYAGLADAYLGDILDTKVRGMVIEKELPDGKAEVRVVLHTKNALGFAQSFEDLDATGFDFANTPDIFGHKAVDVEGGAPAAVGPAHLNVWFTIAAPGDPLPDLLDVLNTTDHLPVRIDFRSTTFDGMGQLLKVHEKAESDAGGNLVFTKEVCDIR